MEFHYERDLNVQQQNQNVMKQFEQSYNNNNNNNLTQQHQSIQNLMCKNYKNEDYDKLRKSVFKNQYNLVILQQLRKTSMEKQYEQLTKIIDEFIDKIVDSQIMNVLIEQGKSKDYLKNSNNCVLNNIKEESNSTGKKIQNKSDLQKLNEVRKKKKMSTANDSLINQANQNKDQWINRIELIFVMAKSNIDLLQQNQAREQLKKFEQLIEQNYLQVSDFSQTRKRRYEQIKSSSNKEIKLYQELIDYQDKQRQEIISYLKQIKQAKNQYKISKELVEDVNMSMIFSILRRMILETQLDLYDLWLACKNIQIQEFNLSISKYVKIDQMVYFSILKNRVLGRNDLQSYLTQVANKPRQVNLFQQFREKYDIVVQQKFPVIKTQEINSEQKSQVSSEEDDE